MDAQGNWKELAAQKEREWKEVTELRYYYCGHFANILNILYSHILY